MQGVAVVGSRTRCRRDPETLSAKCCEWLKVVEVWVGAILSDTTRRYLLGAAHLGAPTVPARDEAVRYRIRRQQHHYPAADAEAGVRRGRGACSATLFHRWNGVNGAPGREIGFQTAISRTDELLRLGCLCDHGLGEGLTIVGDEHRDGPSWRGIGCTSKSTCSTPGTL